jgi:HlyD family secretion protein
MNKLLYLPLFLLLPWGVCRADDAAKDSPTFRTRRVERGSVVQAVRATGSLEPEEVVDVGAQVDGRVYRLGADPDDAGKTVDFGTKVEVGTVLAQLDDSIYKVRVEKAKADVEAAKAKVQLDKAELAYAEAERDRGRKLLATGAITREEADAQAKKCDVVKARVQVAEAGVAAAEASLKEATIQLDYTTIRSPIAGVVIDRRVNVGQAVTASLSAPSLFLIAKDFKRMQVWASVPEADIAQVSRGRAATFTVTAYPGTVFKGKVSQVRLNATKVEDRVTYTAVVDVDNAGGKLLPYLTADVRFVVAERKDVLLVPSTALKWRPRAEQVAPDYRKEFEKVAGRGEENGDRQTGTVWVEEKGELRPVKLRLGISDGRVTEVVEGELKEGTPVVIGTSSGAGK